MTHDNSNLRDWEFVQRVLQVAAKNDDCDSFWWRTDGEYAPVTFLVNCNDLFVWACADCERITPENVERYAKAYEDCAAIEPSSRFWGPLLFCARERKMRPQGAYYKSLPVELWPLFDAAGPERDPKEPGNTSRPVQT